LIPAGSRLLELDETRQVIEPFDPLALVYPWKHPDPRMDALHQTVLSIVQAHSASRAPRTVTWQRVYDEAAKLVDTKKVTPRLSDGYGYPAVPMLSEPWYC
jgi:hypothetical protein